jgi:putative acetyltransferase
MHIRRFRLGEELALFDVFYSSIHLIASRDYTEAQVNAWAPLDLDCELWINRVHGINPYVAEIDGQLVGYADVQENGCIDHFFVSGKHPRQGIGRSLMAAIETEAKNMRLTELTSDVSKTAQPFFAKFGFRLIQQRVPVVRGIEIPNALMRKFV